MQMGALPAVRSHLSQADQKRANKLQQLEFALQLSHPQVFTSYRAAKSWALTELSQHPQRYSGDNHDWHVEVFPAQSGYECSISQYWWSADHCGVCRPTGALAIVQAVLELGAGY